ncbi:MAG TPA: hypothetical protein VGF96_12685 [Terracidiphilus sp.]|jgi:hypothetical protein
MKAKFSGWSGIGIVVLTLFLIECVYRLLFWFWMATNPQAGSHPPMARVRLWLGITVVGGLFWIYLIGREFWKSDSSKKGGTAKKTAAAR